LNLEEISVQQYGTAQLSELGLRERNKVEKIQRIKAAAAKLFSEKGFDEATTRDIAKRAHVGKGTLFLYAKDKRDLVLLLYKDEMERVRSMALGRIRPDMSLCEQLCAIFSVFYEEFYKNLSLSRIMLKELLFYQGTQDHKPHGLSIIIEIKDLISKAQSSGNLNCEEDPFLIARHIYASHQAALRWWISDENPNVTEGIFNLHRTLTLLFKGIGHKP
jgi:AcrR family transcriptional regulator